MLVLQIVQGVRRHFSTRVHEWIFTGILLGLGLQLLRPADTFASSPGYRVMAAVASENSWGIMLVVVACIRAFALTVNGTFAKFKRFSPHARSICAGVSGLVWMSICISIGIANSIGTGEITYAGLAASDFVMFAMIARESGVAERGYRRGRTARTA